MPKPSSAGTGQPNKQSGQLPDKAMAAAALDADPGEWWREMASSYGAKLADLEP